MKIIWSDDNGKVNFIFEDVYWAKMNLNFGIINRTELDVYEILLNSTGGKIKIIARKFRIDKL